MIIESTNLPNPVIVKKTPSYLWPMVLGTFFTLTAVSLPVLFVVAKNNKPTGTMLSPLPAGEQARRFGGQAEDHPGPTPVALNFAQSVNLAQNYLNKAFDLSRNQNQTEADKKAIIASLNQSLTQATNSINLAPNQPEGYVLRAQVLTAISKINPQAASLAKQDLDLAAKLANDKNIVLPKPINPVNLLQDEQARRFGGQADSIIIAAPNENATPSAESSGTESNANQKRFILPAGQTEMTINDSLVKADSFIYLVPVDNHNLPVSLKSKSVGGFTVSLDSAATEDISVDYFIINE
ncbi:hypothetical protein HYU91_02625 [Candidatus Collierbacteria bacterium]|nr:hypothetical protein [Candidatus Collierbacteria bacterium]